MTMHEAFLLMKFLQTEPEKKVKLKINVIFVLLHQSIMSSCRRKLRFHIIEFKLFLTNK